MPSVTNVNVVPPCMDSGGRSWWVSTNTGAPVFVSPHGPVPGANIFRPMTWAPVFVCNAARSCLSASRPSLSVSNIQAVRASAPVPKGAWALVVAGGEAVQGDGKVRGHDAHAISPRSSAELSGTLGTQLHTGRCAGRLAMTACHQ